MSAQPSSIPKMSQPDVSQPAASQPAIAPTPRFFKMEALLPTQGREDIPMAKAGGMSVVLKTYAKAGENELHAHLNEDHTFIILQGEAEFYGPNGEKRRAGKNEGVLIPRGTFYWFVACGDEPLVMARVGAAIEPGVDTTMRVNIKGDFMDPMSAENKEVPLVLSKDDWFR